MHFWCQFLAILLLCLSMPASAQSCQASRAPSQLGSRIAAIAVNEHAEFNGHRINANGYLWKFGSVESEAEYLHDPEHGGADAHRSGRFAWRRVWDYWLSLDKHIPGEAGSRKVTAVPGLLDDPGTSNEQVQVRLSELF